MDHKLGLGCNMSGGKEGYIMDVQTIGGGHMNTVLINPRRMKMDIWARVYIGDRWCEDDGCHREKVKVSKELHITSISVGNPGRFKKEFLGAIEEVFDECVMTNEMIDKYGVKMEVQDE